MKSEGVKDCFENAIKDEKRGKKHKGLLIRVEISNIYAGVLRLLEISPVLPKPQDKPHLLRCG